MNFTFTADSSGSKDAVQIPIAADHEPRKFYRLRIRPPSGHAWSFAKPDASSAEVTRDVDQEYVWERETHFKGLETPLYVALDSGSGTFQASLE